MRLPITRSSVELHMSSLSCPLHLEQEVLKAPVSPFCHSRNQSSLMFASNNENPSLRRCLLLGLDGVTEESMDQRHYLLVYLQTW